MLMGWENKYCQNDHFPNALYIFNAMPIKIPIFSTT